jgi:hypothetical protein
VRKLGSSRSWSRKSFIIAFKVIRAIWGDKRLVPRLGLFHNFGGINDHHQPIPRNILIAKGLKIRMPKSPMFFDNPPLRQSLWAPHFSSVTCACGNPLRLVPSRICYAIEILYIIHFTNPIRWESAASPEILYETGISKPIRCAYDNRTGIAYANTRNPLSIKPLYSHRNSHANLPIGIHYK